MKYWTAYMWQPMSRGYRPVPITHWLRDGQDKGQTACGLDAGNYYAYRNGAEIECPECRRLYEAYITESGGGSPDMADISACQKALSHTGKILPPVVKPYVERRTMPYHISRATGDVLRDSILGKRGLDCGKQTILDC